MHFNKALGKPLDFSRDIHHVSKWKICFQSFTGNNMYRLIGIPWKATDVYKTIYSSNKDHKKRKEKKKINLVIRLSPINKWHSTCTWGRICKDDVLQIQSGEKSKNFFFSLHQATRGEWHLIRLDEKTWVFALDMRRASIRQNRSYNYFHFYTQRSKLANDN